MKVYHKTNIMLKEKYAIQKHNLWALARFDYNYMDQLS